jgi:ribosomal peptide maturation radical SAM protein 1
MLDHMDLYNINILPRKADILLIVPPFGGLNIPSLGVHLLQQYARQEGIELKVLYANMILAAMIGEKHYLDVCQAPTSFLLGERLFAASLFGTPPLGYNVNIIFNRKLFDKVENFSDTFRISKLLRLENICREWVEKISSYLLRCNFKVIGMTSTFEQINASLVIFKNIKKVKPNIITIIGGGNVEGEMAEGMREISEKYLNCSVDYIFSGESEISFRNFVKNVFKEGIIPKNKNIKGELLDDMNSLPIPDYGEYFQQFNYFLKDLTSDLTWIPYESSRGCWWGEKNPCKFCGINEERMKFRKKSPERIIKDFHSLIEKYPSKQIYMVDNIMPYSFFKDLLPQLEKDFPDIQIFYEQKSNLSFGKVELLKNAGVRIIQPGIEALSSSILNRIGKGVSAKQNFDFLRFVSMIDLSVNWNLLYGFPGDKLEDYEQYLEILPLIHHLHPPSAVSHLSIERFSAYFNNPELFGIREIKPIESYDSIFPNDINLNKLAYHFSAKYKSDSSNGSDVIKKLINEVDIWQESWNSETQTHPLLSIIKITDDVYTLVDTRSIGKNKEIQFIDYNKALISLTDCNCHDKELLSWALENKVGIVLEGKYIPLATSTPEVYKEFENKIQNNELSQIDLILNETT